MKRLAIVGSVGLAGREDVYRMIQAVLEGDRPDVVVSGGALGVDSMAAEVAMMLGIAVREYLPRGKGWKYYSERNLQIAADCDHLLRIVSSDSKTYGSGWTRDRAKELGATVEELVAL